MSDSATHSSRAIAVPGLAEVSDIPAGGGVVTVTAAEPVAVAEPADAVSAIWPVPADAPPVNPTATVSLP